MSSSVFPRLAALARAKMQAVFGGERAREDSAALHRWVLLKNSLVSLPDPSASAPASPAASVLSLDDGDEPVLLFPLLDDAAPPPASSEAEWLDSLLAALGDDEDEDEPLALPPPPPPPAYAFAPAPEPDLEPLAFVVPYTAPYPPRLLLYPPPPYPPLPDAVPDAIEDTSDDESEGVPRTPADHSLVAPPRVGVVGDGFFDPLPFGYTEC